MIRFWQQFLTDPLSISERGAAAIMSAFHHLKSIDLNTANIIQQDPATDVMGNTIEQSRILEDGTGVVPLKGMVTKGLGRLGMLLGFTDVGRFRDSVLDMTANPNVRAIALDIASPGGSVIGVRDAAEVVAEATEVKPVMAYTDDMAASAAYYIGAGATSFVAGSGAMVGSIGVYAVVIDWSEMEKDIGIKVHVFRSGAMKGFGIDGISEEQEKLFQDVIDTLGEQFRTFVETHREVSRDDMEGQVFTGLEAAQKGLVTGLAHNLGQAIVGFQSLLTEE